MKQPSRLLICLLLAAMLAPGLAQTPAAAPSQADPSEEMQPKFIWGLLLNIAFRFAMSAFSNWLSHKVSNDLSNVSVMNKLLLTSAQVAIVPLSNLITFGAKSAGAPENTVAGEPVKPLTVDNGKENYQGVHIAVVGFDRAGAATGIRPVTAGFRSGDRIKLKVLPTFDGLLVIENINPRGVRAQIYPPDGSNVVSIKRGDEILLPLGKDEYFEFAGVTGDEQLVITVRDPRAFGPAESKAEVNRKDDNSGSSFVQETAPGTYPVIAQSLRFRHAN